jgi:cob(I)alamin adenosyltransferase
MSVATKKGDKGTTRFFSGEEVSKSHPRLETYGTLDELIAAMGLARSLCTAQSVTATIHAMQRELFQLGAELATPDPANAPFAIGTINGTHVAALDAIVQEIESRITLPASFIIPGGCAGSGALDVARTVCRRLERRMLTLHEVEGYDNPEAIKYINRLSDVLFLLGRAEENHIGVEYDRVKPA